MESSQSLKVTEEGEVDSVFSEESPPLDNATTGTESMREPLYQDTVADTDNQEQTPKEENVDEMAETNSKSLQTDETDSQSLQADSEPIPPSIADNTEQSNQSRVSVYSITSSNSDDVDIPLHNAACAFDVKGVQELLTQPGIAIQETDKRGRNVVHNMVETLGAMEKWDPERATAKAKLVEIVSVLVKSGFDINAVDYIGSSTPLHIAASQTDMADTIKALLMSGSKVNIKGGKESRTALHMAVASRNRKNVEALVDGGADPNAADRNGKTPLHLAASGKHYFSICQFLLRVNANPNLQDRGGKSSLHFAAKARRPELVKELLHGTGTNPGANVNIRDNCGLTPVHTAAVHDITGQVLRELLVKKPDVNAIDLIRKETALHKAVTLNMHENIKVLCRNKNINVNLQDVMGETALHKAFGNTELWLWQTLIKANGDVNIRDNLGQTPLVKALKSKNLTGQCVIDALAWERTERYTYY